MAQNLVEVHIADASMFSFKVKAGQVVKVGELVEISGDIEVQRAGAGSEKVLGIVYGGTVGIDGINDGFEGDKKHVVTVVLIGKANQVYVKAGTGGLVAGDAVKSDASGQGVKATLGTDSAHAVVGLVIKGAVAGERAIVLTN